MWRLVFLSLAVGPNPALAADDSPQEIWLESFAAGAEKGWGTGGWTGRPAATSCDGRPSITWEFPESTEVQYAYIYRPIEARAKGWIEAAAEFRYQGWKDASIQFGFHDGESFFMDDLRHPIPDRWTPIQAREGSITFGIANNWASPPSRNVRYLRFVLRGVPGPGARLEVRAAKLLDWPSPDRPHLLELEGRTVLLSDSSTWWPYLRQRPKDNEFLRFFISDNLFGSSREALEGARAFVHDGVYRLHGLMPVPVAAHWSERAQSSDDSAWRFQWHALMPVHMFLLANDLEPNEEYLFQAREHAMRWLDRDLAKRPEDPVFVWYDHGTAMRTLNLLALWEIGRSRPFDTLSLAQLVRAIAEHARVLAAESFVARNQPLPFHNHAVFQAVALLAAGILLPEFAEAPTWRRLGTERLLDQITHLVTREGALNENSFGYHYGMTSFCDSLLRWMESARLPEAERIRPVCTTMAQFLKDVAYPNGQLPAFGDTIHGMRADRQGKAMEGSTTPGDRVFPDSGYALLRYLPAGKPTAQTRQLNLIASSQSVTHKHADNLSFTFFFAGREWLTDPGLYAYGRKDVFDSFFRSPRAHNAPVLDGQDYDPKPGSARITRWDSHEAVSLIIAEHTGYPQATIRRTILVDKEGDAIFVCDRLLPEKGVPPKLSQWFQASPEVDIRTLAAGAIALSAPGTAATLLVVPIQPNDLTVRSFRGQKQPFVAGFYFPSYGEAQPLYSFRYQADRPTRCQIVAIKPLDALPHRSPAPGIRTALTRRYRELMRVIDPEENDAGCGR